MHRTRPILAVDFHGVLCSHVSGNQSTDLSDDPPVKGAIRWLLGATDHFQVCVTCARFDINPDTRRQCLEWLLKHGCPKNQVTLEPNYDKFDKSIYICNERPRATITLDDRAYVFRGKFPEYDALVKFKPWHVR